MKNNLIKSILFIAAAFTSINSFAQMTVVDSFKHGGTFRSYRLYIPAVYDASKAVPVVLNMHGLGSDALEQENYGDFRKIADTANFIIVHPTGSNVILTYKGWNTFGTIATGADDLGFIAALLDTVEAKYKVDKNRIYATGMSNGGFMSYELACFMSNRITAIASVTGSMTEERRMNCKTSHAMPIMEIHGTADGTVGYDGTNYLSGDPAFTHIDSLMKYWISFNRCTATPVKTLVPNSSTTDGCTAEHYVWGGGKAGSSIELYKIIGGDHSWPGSAFSTGKVTNQDFNASKEIWRFFSQYKLDDFPVGISTIAAENFDVQIYPNPATENVTIEVKNSNLKVYQIQLKDALGRLIFTKQTAEKLTSIPGNNIQPGIYYLQISNNDASIVRKVVFK